MLKQFLVRSLRHRWLGVPAALAAQAVGATPTSRKISLLCNFVPRRVDVSVPEKFADGRGFAMHGAGARDQVSRIMWWLGWDGFEKPMPDFFAALSRDARRVLDIGAYSGLYSLIAATCSPTAQIEAFEPFPPPRAWLEKNVAINGLGDRIRVVAAAVGEQSGEAEFFTPADQSKLIESASSLNPAHRAKVVGALKAERVKVVTLDEFVADRGLGPIDLMKIDVESFEPQVLRGGFRMINESRPFIFLEILPDADFEALEAVRNELGYVSAHLLPTGIQWEDRLATSPRHHDHVFCPAEKKERLEAIAASLGYPAIPAMATG